MAKIIDKVETKTVETFCEHMGESVSYPDGGISVLGEYLRIHMGEYCPICRAKLMVVESETRKVCSDCGEYVLKLSKSNSYFTYCSHCGRKFEG